MPYSADSPFLLNRERMKKILSTLFLTLLAALSLAGKAGSVYTQRPDDPEAVYFTAANYPITADGKTDVSDALQKAVNDVKETYNFGIVFIPEGRYTISKTVYVPNSVRLIGYGKNRPVIALADNAPGYQNPCPQDKGNANYMFWFTSALHHEGEEPQDATSSTFYSALSNIDLEIGKGNPYAVALRTHYAQHSFISYSDIRIGSGKAGIFDVGNELESVNFFGGEYGIYTTKTSPSWQMTIINAHFEGQRSAAIQTQEGGLTIMRMTVRNVPVGIYVQPDRSDKIYMEDCNFSQLSQAAISLGNEGLSPNQLSMRNVVCEGVPQFLELRDSGEKVMGKGKIYRVKDFSYGLHMKDMAAEPRQLMSVDMEPLQKLPAGPTDNIKPIPDMSKWVNIRDLGAVGDGQTDNTEVFRKAIAQYETIYLPQGWYVVSDSIALKKNTALIGLNPVSTQIQIKANTPAFSGFGAPKALLETPQGGSNFVSGIGLNTSTYNYRAVGCKWMAGEESYMNDIKFFGNNMRKGKPVAYKPASVVDSPEHPGSKAGMNKAYDNQHWSLWITNGGGGVFKDIWTANSYAASGLLITDTDTPGCIYEMSVEHHVRNEVTMRNVSNWRIYALQLEEETPVSLDCQPIELQDCHDLFFANLYLFRVIWIETPARIAVRTWDCSGLEFYNVHNFTQMRFTTDIVFKDMNTGLEVRPWEFTRLTITGKESGEDTPTNKDRVEKLASGFEYLEGMAKDSKGNVYFSEQRMKRVYKWDVAEDRISLVADMPWQPLSLACDTEDNLLVVYKYFPQPGFSGDSLTDYPDKDGTTFCLWGNTGFSVGVYSIKPNCPEESVRQLDKVPFSSVSKVAKAIYPAHRWRDLHDFDEISLWKPEYCYMAPDGKTIVPEYYDLLRSSSTLEAVPGKAFYASDEYNHRLVKTSVEADGSLSSLTHFANVGEFGSAVDANGNVYIADGNIQVFSPDGKALGTIRVPERPTSLSVSGDTLYIAARTSLYRYPIGK